MSTIISPTAGFPIRRKTCSSTQPVGYYCKECRQFEFPTGLPVVSHIVSAHQSLVDDFFARMKPVFDILKASERSRNLITHLSAMYLVGEGILLLGAEWEEIDCINPKLVTSPDFIEGYKEWEKSRVLPDKDDGESSGEDFGPEEYADEILSKDPVFTTLHSISETCGDLHDGMVAAYAFLLADMDTEKLKQPQFSSLVLVAMCLGFRYKRKQEPLTQTTHKRVAVVGSSQP